MSGRRRVLRVLVRVAAAGALPLWPARLLGLGRRDAGANGVPRGFGAELQEGVTAMGRRVYSEQGIPMVLACEDLAGTGRVPSAGVMNAEFAPVFARSAEAWEQLHPQAPADEVASLVELLAYRDFASGGRSAG